MKLALIAGNSCKKLEGIIVATRDDIEVECFKDFDEFITFVTQRMDTFDRTVVMAETLKMDESEVESRFEILSEFVKNNCIAMRVVLVTISGKTNNSYMEAFEKYFNSVIYTTMTIAKLTSVTLLYAVINDIEDLNNKYGIERKEVYTTENIYIDNSQSNEQNNKKLQKEKGKSFLGIFGNIKKQKQPIEKAVEEIENNIIDEFYEADSAKDESTIHENCDDEDFQSEINEDNSNENIDNIENIEINKDESIQFETIKIKKDFENNFDSFDSENNNSLESNINDKYENSIKDTEKSPEIEEEETLKNNDSDIDTIFEESKNVENENGSLINNSIEEFSSLEEVEDDIDLYNLVIDNNDRLENINERENLQSVDDVDIIDINIELESENRENFKEIIKVPIEVEKIVEVEKVVEVEKLVEVEKVVEIEKLVEVEKIIKINTGSKETKLSKILSGKEKKIFIVTGDRGSGITQTSLSLLNYFAKSIRVLYIDLDDKYHGLFNYVDYSNIAKYDKITKNGLMFIDNKNYNSCIIKYAKNIDILTSDYGCESNKSKIKSFIENFDILSELNYGVVVIDCPNSRLELCSSIIQEANIIVTMGGTTREYINTIINLENTKLDNRTKNRILQKSIVLVKSNNFKKIIKEIQDRITLEEFNWFKLKYIQVTDNNINTELLGRILEG